MTARRKALVVLAALVFANLAIAGAKAMLS